MACGNNHVSRSSLQSAPAAISMPTASAQTSHHTSARHQVAVVLEEARSAIARAERKASAAVTPAVASEIVKDAKQALSKARRMHGPAADRAALVSELERRFDAVKSKLETAAHTSEHAVDRLRKTLLGVPAHLADAGHVGARTLTAFGTAAEITMATFNFAHVIGDATQGHLLTADRFTSSSEQAEEHASQLNEQYAENDKAYREQHQPAAE
jgi:hypothetical protein